MSIEDSLRNRLSTQLRTLMSSRPELCTQMAMAARSGVSQVTISRVLRASQPVSLDNLARIAQALDVDPAHLLMQPHEASLLARYAQLDERDRMAVIALIKTFETAASRREELARES